MMARLAGVFLGTATIQAATVTSGDNGEAVETWATLLADVPCQIVPDTGQGSDEERRENMDLQRASHTINLRGPYPTVTEGMRVIAGGVTYGVLLVVRDSLGAYTALTCERLEV